MLIIMHDFGSAMTTTCEIQPEAASDLGRVRAGAIEVSSHPLRKGIVIVVCGEVDLATTRVVEEKLLRAEESHDLVVLDLSRTSFMDSTGLHMIVAAERRLRERGGRLVVVEGPPQVRRLLKLTHIADHLELVHDVAALEHDRLVRG